MVKVIGTSVGNFSRMCHSGTIYQSSDTEAPIKRPGSPDNASGGSETGRSDAEPESSGDLLELLRKLAPLGRGIIPILCVIVSCIAGISSAAFYR